MKYRRSDYIWCWSSLPLLEVIGTCVSYSLPKAHPSHDKNEGVLYLRVRLRAGKACVLVQIGMCPSMWGSAWGHKPPSTARPTVPSWPGLAEVHSSVSSRAPAHTATQAALVTVALHRDELYLDSCLVKQYGTKWPSSAGTGGGHRGKSLAGCSARWYVSAKTRLESLLPQPLESGFCVRQQSSAPVTKHKHP